jgi:hypothetical protein
MQLFSNNGSSVLAAAITNSGTTLTFVGGGGAEFNAPTGGDYELLTLTDGVNAEIVKMTARSSDSATITRGQESTTALAWPIGTTAEGRVTKGSLNRFPQTSATGTNALALGTAAVADVTDALAIGHSAIVHGVSSIGIGETVSVSADNALGIGHDITALTGGATNSISIGGTLANEGDSSILIGKSSAIDQAFPAWAATHFYEVGECIEKVSSTNIFVCVVEGTSGGSEPTWTTSQYNQKDGSAQWLYIGTGTLSLNDGVVIGNSSRSVSLRPVILGYKAVGSNDAVAIGTGATATQGSALALGTGAKAGYGIALGQQAKTIGPNRWMAGQTVGNGSSVIDSSGRVFVVIASSGGSITSASTEPTWPTSNTGDTVIETGTLGGTVTWVFAGYSSPGSSFGAVAVGQSSSCSNTKSVAVGSYAVAAGSSSVAIGSLSVCSVYNTAVGSEAKAINEESVCIGGNAQARASGGWAGIAIGSGAVASGAASCNVIGDYAENRISECTVISGMHLVPKSGSASASYEHYYLSGAQSTVFSKEIDLKTLADNVATITIPTGATFFVDEIGLIVTLAAGVSTQPNVSFGITGNTTSILASTASTKSAAKGRDIFTPLSKDGVNSLTASVKTAATGTTLKGRFYWKGILVEDE